MFPFTDEVIHFVVLLLNAATEDAVRASMAANADVMQYTSLSSPPVNQQLQQLGDSAEESGVPTTSNAGSYVVVCEFEADDGKPIVVSTTDAASVFYLLSHHEEERDQGQQQFFFGAAAMAIPSANKSDIGTVVAQHKPVACVLIHKRASVHVSQQQGRQQLSVRDLLIQSLDLETPLETLQRLLQGVYDPLLKARRNQGSLRVHLQDLLSSISATQHLMPPIHLRRFIPDDVVELCERFPNVEVAQLMDRLGEKARDPAYARSVLQIRNRCCDVLPLEKVLSGTADDASGAVGVVGEGTAPNNTVGMGMADTADEVGGAAGGEGWTVQKKIAYWQGVLAWIEEVLGQLQTREWWLVHRLLAHRVQTSYVPEYIGYAQQVRNYIKFLQDIPEKKLATVEAEQFTPLADSIFATVMASPHYPPRLTLELLTGIVSEMVSALVRFMEDQFSVAALLMPQVDATSTSWLAERRAREHHSVTLLEPIRHCMRELESLQKQYIKIVDTLHLQARMHSMIQRQTTGHPRITALLTRCTAVRRLIESHWMLIHQLSSIFAGPAQPARGPETEGVSWPLPQTAGSIEAHKHLLSSLQAAYDVCISHICGVASTEVGTTTRSTPSMSGGDGNNPYHQSPHSAGPVAASATAAGARKQVLLAANVMWRTGPIAQNRFDSAIAQYYAQVDRCDDGIALLVNDLLSNEQNTTAIAGAVETSIAFVYAGEAVNLSTRLFSTFTSVRFLRLTKVQRVVERYQGPVSEKLSVAMKHTQELYFNMKVTKRQVRYAVARFHLSALVAQIMWERHLEKTLRGCLHRWDCVAERGWHHLLSLRNVEHRWRLNAALAEYVRFSLDDLLTPQLREGSEVHGCAYALALLRVLFSEDAAEWSSDPYLHVAETLVSAEDPTAVKAATDRLSMLGVRDTATGVRAQLREVRSTLTIIQRRVDEKVAAWCDAAHLLRTSCHSDAQSGVLTGPIFRIVEVPSTDRAPAPVKRRGIIGAAIGNEGIGATNLRRGNNYNVTTDTSHRAAPSTPPTSVVAADPHTFIISVTFPDGFFTLANDMRYLSSIQLLDHSPAMQQTTAPVVEFVRANETRSRLARCLDELLRVYYAAVNGEDRSLALLATGEYQGMNECFRRGFTLRWSDEVALPQFAHELSEKTMNFVRVVQYVRDRTTTVHDKIRSFHVRAFHPEAIAQRVREIRSVVDALLLRCTNAHVWIKEAQPLLDAALLTQIKYLLRGWTLDFTAMRGDLRYLSSLTADSRVFRLRPLRVRMRVVYKEVKLETSASVWRHHWITELNKYFGWVYVLPRLYNDDDVRRVGVRDGVLGELLDLVEGADGNGGKAAATHLLGSSSPTSPTPAAGAADANGSHQGSSGDDDKGYKFLLERLPTPCLAEPLEAIEQCVVDAIAVEQEWQQSQQLLNLDVAVMQQRFGNDLRRWSTALQLMRRVSTQLMDFTQPNTLLGGILISAEDAQAELSRKLDQVSQFTQSKFKQVLETELETVYRKTSADRARADELDVISNINDAAAFLCEVPRVKRELADGEMCMNLMVEAEESLQQLGYLFPEHWIYASTVAEEYRSLKDLVERKMKALEFRRPYLTESVIETAAELDRRTEELEKQVAALESNTAKRSPSAVQSTIAALHESVISCNEEALRVSAIQEALGETAYSTAVITRLMAEVQGMREVWGYVAEAYARLSALGATLFFEMVPRRLTEELQQIEMEVEGYPENVHGFTVYKDLVALITRLIGYRRLMLDLRSDAMSPLERAQRHWQSLKQQLGVQWVLAHLTVQDVWDSHLEEHVAIFSGVLELAQGEHRIEMQLQAISNFWESFEFSVIAYKAQVGLLRGWDVVLERLTDDLSTFGGIRSSPYFNSQYVIAMTNESEARLDRLRRVLETLMEVQKRWVYLDGIFAGNTEIRAQLPHDTAQFERTSRELTHVLPKVRAAGTLPTVKPQFFLDDEKLLHTLERISAQLSATQRALTAYLDAQRRRFPRFFFVGDDDLLEILGSSSNNPVFLAKHLGKMFTALSSFTVSNVGTLVAFSSATGERVSYALPVTYAKRALHEWLLDAEKSMARTLRASTLRAFEELSTSGDATAAWMKKYPSQVVCLAVQLWWVQLQERSFSSANAQSPAVAAMESLLGRLATAVVDASATLALRQVCGQLITIAVNQRDVSRILAAKGVTAVTDFYWLRVFRAYQSTSEVTGGERGVECRMADASLYHGFEYIGQYERLVQTPLTDKAYLTLMQALHTRLGGSPTGPAGTGKTETVKALGLQLGRHVLVFNCDDTFDFQAMSRIFRGLCQVGAWGCFDEFNRLEERIISALSQQIELIQNSLRARAKEVELGDHHVPLHEDMGIFITMNPGYAGRSKLPGNLKQLFRTVTMAVPDRETIAEVMLFAQGFQCAELLARKVVPLFRLCEEQFSKQSHYDFGLRALKSALVAAGARKRQSSRAARTAATVDEKGECLLLLGSTIATVAPELVMQDVSLFYPLLRDFFPGVELPDLKAQELREAILDVCAESGLAAAPHWVDKICQLHYTKETRHGVMIAGPSGTGKTTAWKALMSAMVRVDRQLEVHAYVVEPKVLSKGELFGTLDITTREWRDGVFTSILRRVLDVEMQAAGAPESREDPAIIVRTETPTRSKETDAGKHSSSTAVMRREYWVIFDGDVDPEWVENLNSVLDDNRILTLPNGERLSLSQSVRLFFEVQSLRYATPATVSRCGMLWFDEGILPLPCILAYVHHQLASRPLIDRRGRRQLWSLEEDLVGITSADHAQRLTSADSVVTAMRGKVYGQYIVSCASPGLEMVLGSSTRRPSPANCGEESEPLAQTNSETVDPSRSSGGGVAHAASVCPVQQRLVAEWAKEFSMDGFVGRSLALMSSPAFRGKGIMEYCILQHLQSTAALLLDGVWGTYLAEQEKQSLASPDDAWVRRLAERILHHAVFWGAGATLTHEDRSRLAAQLLPGNLHVGGVPHSIMEVELDYPTGEWALVRSRVSTTDIAAQQIGANDTVIQTVDTCRHESVLAAWLGAGRSAILCGPPGSGKTLTISAVLNNLLEYQGVFLNFSSGTAVETVMKALEQYCETSNTARGLVMTPVSGRKVLLFCDEINLPALDRYGTQVVVQLLRQIVERGGFYRPRDNVWVITEGIQVVGACNPPTDPGRVPLSPRFLRWAPVLRVGFPTPESLQIIYGSYCRAILRPHPTLSATCAAPLAAAMVQVFTTSQKHFTTAQQPHYLYSPRELTRWTRALYEGVLTLDEAQQRVMTTTTLVRLALHEGLRIFSDRLVLASERELADRIMDESFQDNFPDVSQTAYDRPILFSTLLSHAYTEGSTESLRAFLQDRLDAFCDEEMASPMVVYDAMIDHIVRIHRVLRQPLGHVLIAGSSGVGKTVTARLAAWLGGFFVTWLKVRRDYTLVDFEDDLRVLLRRTGCDRESVCFIFDESNILQPSFLEYMNALLASGEVPGLFEGEEWAKLMQDTRDAIVATQSTARSKVNDLHLRDRGSGGRDARLATAATPAGAGTSSTTHRASAGTTADYVDVANDQEVYKWFLSNVREHLHVVFTINPSSSDFSTRAVASPALFNRCTINWLGDWEEETVHQITVQRTREVKLLPACPGAFESEEEAHKALAHAISEVHSVTRNINTAIRARHANQGTFITPRHFTDCLSHFISLTKGKAQEMMEQLHHLRSGLEKLQDTATEVAQRKEELRESEATMAVSSVKAQRMLEHIISETDITRKEQAAAEAIRPGLMEEESALLADRRDIEEQLAVAEPALIEAEKALATVKADHLREIRAYTTPPPMVKRVLEAVCALMGERNSDDWDMLKSYIRRDDFLSSVKAFKSDHVTDSARERVGHMTADKKFTIEAAYRASKAAGPLLQWVIAQLQYSEIHKRVAPLRAKIDKLIAEHEKKLQALRSAEKVIAEKETLLGQLMADYQATTEQIATLKQRIMAVSAQCERATTITSQLLHERERWGKEVRDYGTEARTTLGDCVLSAAFLAYIGYFDEHTRTRVLVPRWAALIQANGIPTHSELRVMEFLVPPVQRLSWERSGLPNDHLCMENALIMDRSNRYTLLIDPSGTAAAFLQQLYSTQKVRTASFTRPGYLKELEMAARFGYPIIMEDAEHLDPAVGPLLNHEFRHTGSHRVVRIGANDVDLSPSFLLFLLTRDPNYQPSPDLSGQVCLVNFTVTLSSLQSQCLHRILVNERPDVDKKRAQLLRVQGEYQLRLRVLEQDVLTCISSSQGSLLDDDQLIDSLTALKNEVRSIKEDIDSSAESMQLIERVETRYSSISTVAARIYFSLKRLDELSPFYAFNVAFMFRAVGYALATLPEKKHTPSSPNSSPSAVSDVLATAEENERLQRFTAALFAIVYQRVARGIFRDDHLVLALRLAQLRSAVRTDAGEGGSDRHGAISEEEWEWLLESVQLVPLDTSGQSAATIPAVFEKSGVFPASQQARAGLSRLLSKPAYAEVRQSMTQASYESSWRAFLTSRTPIQQWRGMPDGCFKAGTPLVRRAFLLTMLLCFTRRESFVGAAFALLSLYFDGDTAEEDEKVSGGASPFHQAGTGGGPPRFFNSTANLQDISTVLPELGPATPVLMVSDANVDPSVHVEAAAAARQYGNSIPLRVIALGSREGAESADQSLAEAMARGGWVLLKNVHLAKSYMTALEKRLHSEHMENRTHSNFRLFLTVDRDAADDGRAALPVNLLEDSVVVVFEAQPGIKASLVHTYGALAEKVAAAATAAMTVTWQRVLLAASWLHAVVMERLFYVQIGWSEAYEFSDVDFARVVQAVEAWTREGGSEVQWPSLQAIVSVSIYGGRVSNVFDQHVMDVLCSSTLCERVLGPGQVFARKAGGTSAPPAIDPAAKTRAELLRWVGSLPGSYSDPQWLGLPSGASRMLLSRQAQTTLERLSSIQTIMTDELATSSTATAEVGVGGDGALPVRSRWATTVGGYCASWDAPLRRGLEALERDGFVSRSLASADALASVAGAAAAAPDEARNAPPMSLAVEREVVAAVGLLRGLLADVSELRAVCAGELAPSSAHRAIIEDLVKGHVPVAWGQLLLAKSAAVAVADGVTVAMWVADVMARAEHSLRLAQAVEAGRLAQSRVTLGLLLSPGAFLTAFKQERARALRASLEDLQPHVEVVSETSLHCIPEGSAGEALLLDRVTLFGASVDSKGLCALLHSSTATDAVVAPLSTQVGIRWTWDVQSGGGSGGNSAASTIAMQRSGYIAIPLYASSTRKELLKVVYVRAAPSEEADCWYERGVSMSAWAAEE